jgi:hypothetical protein
MSFSEIVTLIMPFILVLGLVISYFAVKNNWKISEFF